MGRNPHAAAEAQRGPAITQLARFKFIDQDADDHRAGGAQRMAHGDRATVHVDFSSGTPSSFLNFIGTTAKVSLISNRSMSSMMSPEIDACGVVRRKRAYHGQIHHAASFKSSRTPALAHRPAR